MDVVKAVNNNIQRDIWSDYCCQGTLFENRTVNPGCRLFYHFPLTNSVGVFTLKEKSEPGRDQGRELSND